MTRLSKPRTRLLDHAARLFLLQGYHATGINQVVEEAGVAKASLYRLFGSKTDLLLAYLQREHERWFADWAAWHETVPDAAGKLLALFDFRQHRQQASAFAGCRFVKIMAELAAEECPAAIALARAHKDRLRAEVAHLVAALHPTGAADDLTDTVLLLFEGAGVSSTLLRSDEPLRRAQHLVRHLLASTQASPHPSPAAP